MCSKYRMHHNSNIMTRYTMFTILAAMAALLFMPATAYTTGFTLVNEADVVLRAVGSDGRIQYLTRMEAMYVQGEGMVNIKLQRWCPGFQGKGNWADVMLAEAEYTSSGSWFRLTHLRTNQRNAEIVKTSYGTGRKALNVGGQYPIKADMSRDLRRGNVYPLAMYIMGPGKVCDGDCNDWRRDLCNCNAP